MDRRLFLTSLAGATALTAFQLPMACGEISEKAKKPEKLEKPLSAEDTNTKRVFEDLMKKAHAEGWAKLAIGECIGRFGNALLGTPYKGGTLDPDGREACRVNFVGLDCVTFMENCLGMARILKKGQSSFEDLIREVTYTRYRNGVLDGYVSRLHYTSDWIADNIRKKTVRDATQELGGNPRHFAVDFMSKNPQYYKQLTKDPELVSDIANSEKEIQRQELYVLPQDALRKAQPGMQTGDLVAITTSKEGLDYAHTGMIYVNDEGERRFLHASSRYKRVMLDVELYEYVMLNKSQTGATIIRPLEV